MKKAGLGVNDMEEGGGGSTPLPSPRPTARLHASPDRSRASPDHHQRPPPPTVLTTAMLGAQKLARFLVVVTFIGMAFVAVPLYSHDLILHGAEQHHVAWLSAGSLVLLTVPFSVSEIQ